MHSTSPPMSTQKNGLLNYPRNTIKWTIVSVNWLGVDVAITLNYNWLTISPFLHPICSFVSCNSNSNSWCHIKSNGSDQTTITNVWIALQVSDAMRPRYLSNGRHESILSIVYDTISYEFAQSGTTFFNLRILSKYGKYSGWWKKIFFFMFAEALHRIVKTLSERTIPTQWFDWKTVKLQACADKQNYIESKNRRDRAHHHRHWQIVFICASFLLLFFLSLLLQLHSCASVINIKNENANFASRLRQIDYLSDSSSHLSLVCSSTLNDICG